MTGFGGWLLQRRIARIALMVGLFPLGVLGILSAAVVVCVAELRGWRDAAGDCLIALAVLLFAVVIMQGNWTAVLFSAATGWLTALALGALTALYGSLTLAMQVVLVLATAGVLLFSLWVGDPVDYWEGVIADLVDQLSRLGVEVTEPDLLATLAPYMTGASAALMVVSSVLALLIGTWWASSAGGRSLREMFVEIRLGFVVGTAAIVAGVVSLFEVAGASNVLLVLGVGFAFQGLSVVHWHAGQRGWPGIALLPVYVPLLLGPSVVVIAMFLLSTVGFLDNWFGLRRVGSSSD